MSVLGRLIVASGERLDLADLLSIDSYTAGDFQFLIQGLIGTSNPLILTGFEVITPSLAINTPNISIEIANAVVFYPTSLAGPFWVGLGSGNINAQPLVPQLFQNATNYIYVTFTTTQTSQDSRAFWDPDLNGGTGGEFTQNIDTESVLTVQVGVSTVSFPANTVPICQVVMGPSTIESIEDCRQMMFRLGSGGLAPNPFNRFTWPSLPSAQYAREETPYSISSGTQPNPFEGGDKNIQNLKQWMDAVMSKLAELGGTVYWYEDASTYNLVSLFTDALETSVITKGTFRHSSVTPGLLTWSEDVKYEIVGDNREYILRASNVTMANGEVAYIALNRNGQFNGNDQPVAWTNGATYVNTINNVVGLFANLSQGDYVKRFTDPDSDYLRVEQFFSSTNASGAPTSAALAQSILLSGAYQGPTINDFGTYDQGIYQTSDSPADVVVTARNNAATISALGGNFNWIAFRDDTVEGIGNVTTTSLTISNITCTEDTALVTCTAAHNLSNGYYVTISGTTNYNGTFKVEVESSVTFSITVASSFPVETSGTARYAVVQTVATTNGYGLQLESADHGFSTDETIIVAGTTNYNGSYLIGVIDATHFQMGVAGAYAPETAGTATLARIFVRNQAGTLQIVQGVSVDPDGPYDNIKLFIGMNSDSEVNPQYATTISNVLEGEENFNTLSTENVTNRLSNLTAMMADKAQDKTIKYLPIDIELVGNTTNGANQEVTFTSSLTPYLTILQPGTVGNAVVALPTSTPGIVLPVNSSAYISINRNAATTPTWTVALNSAVPVDENIFVIASRLNETDIYLWNGSEWPVGETPFAGSGTGITQVNLYDPLDTTLPTGSVTIDGVTVTANMLVAFSNLSSGNNEIYQANGSGSTISGWTAQYAFDGNLAPSTGNLIIITQGTIFANQIGEFNGTTWAFNNVVRYFGSGSDVINYWEQSGLMTTTLSDNTTLGTVFSVGYAGSQNIIVDYSVLRGSGPEYKETGTLYITTDGTNVAVTEGGANLNGSSGVTFSGVISGSNLVLQYTTTSTGSSATMKYSIKRWSDAAGGPSGPPSYSAAAGSGVTSLNGEAGALTLVAGSNITITPSGSNITISSTGGGGANQYLSNLLSPTAINQSLTFDNAATYIISPADRANTHGHGLTVNADNTTIAGTSLSPGLAGTLLLQGGNVPMSGYGVGGAVDINGGTGYNRQGGSVNISGGNTAGVGTGGGVNISGAFNTDSNGGGGGIALIGGDAGSSAGQGGGVTIAGGAAAVDLAGAVQLQTQTGLSGIYGLIQWQDGSQGTAGYVLTSTDVNGTGTWMPPVGGVLTGPFTILDNQPTPVTLFSYTASTALYSVFEYSILKNGSYRVGRFLVATDGSSTTSESDDWIETGTSGVVLTATYSGGSVNVQYTSTNTGASGTLKYYVTSWS